MMRTLLFLSLVGAAIYGFLVISGGNTNENQTIQTRQSSSRRATEFVGFVPCAVSKPKSAIGDLQATRSNPFSAS